MIWYALVLLAQCDLACPEELGPYRMAGLHQAIVYEVTATSADCDRARRRLRYDNPPGLVVKDARCVPLKESGS